VVQESDRIKQHIDQTRAELGRNLSELEQRVKDVVDWRAYFDQDPFKVLAGAFGAGLLLGLVATRPRIE
jgi:ElaB/YqjD/DUF883 family membrane-anchored ribosome-binding protein